MKAAPDRSSVGQARPEQEFFCFKVGELRLGVPSETVLEVFRAGRLTPLPRTPAFVMGVTGHRGQVLPVLDLLRFLGKGEARVGERTRLCVGASGPYVAAVVADSVLGLRRILTSDILPPPLGGDAAAEHLLGVVQPGTRGEGIALLNFAKLLQTARQRAVMR
ncbi:MAG: chemotaxis protein CheW [Myxococcaceae bacterium]|nr:chemotaxis protein CheW [Myxococcaceae bacterium]